MTTAPTTPTFEPGSAGWSAEEFAHGEMVHQWEVERLELILGVITQLPAVETNSGMPLFRLADIIHNASIINGVEGLIWMEAIQYISSETRLQNLEARHRGHSDPLDTPLYVLPRSSSKPSPEGMSDMTASSNAAFTPSGVGRTTGCSMPRPSGRVPAARWQHLC